MKKKSGPLYFRIKEDIKERIEKSEFTKGQIIPTEKELCEHYHACRVTIRRALDELISEEILERGFGKSATVKCEPVPRTMNSLSGLYEELEKTGIKCSSFILSSTVIPADKEIAEKMKLQISDEVIRIERLRYASGVPLCFQELYLNHQLCPGMQLKNGEFSLYKTLDKEYGVKVQVADQTIKAAMSDYRMSAMLELPSQTCMLLVSRTAYDSGGECVEYSHTYYVSNRYQLDMTLKREEQN